MLSLRLKYFDSLKSRPPLHTNINDDGHNLDADANYADCADYADNNNLTHNHDHPLDAKDLLTGGLGVIERSAVSPGK